MFCECFVKWDSVTYFIRRFPFGYIHSDLPQVTLVPLEKWIDIPLSVLRWNPLLNMKPQWYDTSVRIENAFLKMNRLFLEPIDLSTAILLFSRTLVYLQLKEMVTTFHQRKELANHKSGQTIHNYRAITWSQDHSIPQPGLVLLESDFSSLHISNSSFVQSVLFIKAQ